MARKAVAVAILVLSAVACGPSQPSIVRVEQPTAASAAAPEPADVSDSGFVTFHLATPGAVVILVCDRPAARKMIPRFPLRVRFGSNERCQLRATKPGFSDYVEDIHFEPGVTEKSITIRLVPTIQAQLPRAPRLAAQLP